MKKKTKPTPKSQKVLRVEERTKQRNLFIASIKNSLLSEELKNRLLQAYFRATERFAKYADPKTEAMKIPDWSTKCTYTELEEITNEIKNFDIFSDKFFSMLNSKWLILCSTYNPHMDYEY